MTRIHGVSIFQAVKFIRHHLSDVVEFCKISSAVVKQIANYCITFVVQSYNIISWVCHHMVMLRMKEVLIENTTKGVQKGEGNPYIWQRRICECRTINCERISCEGDIGKVSAVFVTKRIQAIEPPTLTADCFGANGKSNQKKTCFMAKRLSPSVSH